MKIDPDMRERIAEAVSSYGSQAAVARAIGVSRAAVSGWVKGQTKSLKGENLHALSNVTGYSIAYILNGDLPKMNAELVASALEDAEEYLTDARARNEQEIKLLNRFRAMSDEHKDELLGMAAYFRTVSFTGDPSNRRKFEQEIKVSDMTIDELIEVLRKKDR